MASYGAAKESVQRGVRNPDEPALKEKGIGGAGKGSAGASPHHLRLIVSEHGGLEIHHHISADGPAVAVHHFGAGDGAEVAAHLGRHLPHSGLAALGEAKGEGDIARAEGSDRREIEA